MDRIPSTIDSIHVAAEQQHVSDRPMQTDFMQPVFDATHVIEAIAVLLWRDQRYLDYNDTVAMFWPEFAADSNNPDAANVTIADVLRHQTTLYFLNTPLDPTQDIGHKHVGEHIAAEASARAARTQHARHYHMVTRGAILSELSRRFDPTDDGEDRRRCLSQFLKDDAGNALRAAIEYGWAKSDKRYIYIYIHAVPWC